MQHYVGKFVGGVLGFLFAGPWGALVGLVVGSLHDRAMLERAQYAGEAEAPHGRFASNVQQTTFTLGVIVLGAKMCKADGRVSRVEIDAFRRVFNIPDSRIDDVGTIFDEARKTSSGYEPYAARLAQVFRRHPVVLEEILTGLFRVAIADSRMLSPAEGVFLQRVAVIFGFNETDFRRIAARSGVYLPGAAPSAAKKSSPYDVLGLPETATAADIKRTYRALIRKHHPDKLVAEGLPREMIDQANEKMKRINAAYDAICKERGIN